MRIVSLLSSATEIVHLLGLEKSLVGISHECDHPSELLDRPRVSRVRFDPEGMDSAGIDAAVRAAMEQHGSVYQIDAELLRELRPDVLLTQAVCEVCAVPTASVRDIVQSLPGSPTVVSLDAHTLDDILGTVEQVALAAEVAERGREAADALRSRLARVDAAVAGRTAPRVLLLEWLDPPFIPGHWVPEMVTRAGGECIVGRRGERSHEVAWSDLGELDPDVVLVEPCGFDLKAARREAARFRGRLERIAGRALGTGNLWALDSAWFSRSGPRVVQGVEVLASSLHGVRFPETSSEGIAVRCG